MLYYFFSEFITLSFVLTKEIAYFEIYFIYSYIVHIFYAQITLRLSQIILHIKHFQY
jgi:hypothetical protein